jgi:hypothetical protein
VALVAMKLGSQEGHLGREAVSRWDGRCSHGCVDDEWTTGGRR